VRGIFGDVACPSPFADWIENLYAENVTGGCSASPCSTVRGTRTRRGQMAVFISKTFGCCETGARDEMTY
jgi:hypothetical protein